MSVKNFKKIIMIGKNYTFLKIVKRSIVTHKSNTPGQKSRSAFRNLLDYMKLVGVW